MSGICGRAENPLAFIVLLALWWGLCSLFPFINWVIVVVCFAFTVCKDILLRWTHHNKPASKLPNTKCWLSCAMCCSISLCWVPWHWCYTVGCFFHLCESVFIFPLNPDMCVSLSLNTFWLPYLVFSTLIQAHWFLQKM